MAAGKGRSCRTHPVSFDHHLPRIRGGQKDEDEARRCRWWTKHQWTRFKCRGDVMRIREGLTLTEQQMKRQQVPRLNSFANVEYSCGLTALTAPCTRDTE